MLFAQHSQYAHDLREFVKSAKGADARRQTAEKLPESLGGVLYPATVLRELLKRVRP